MAPRAIATTPARLTSARPGRRREHYRHWLRHEVLPALGERVLSFVVQAALPWGVVNEPGLDRSEPEKALAHLT